MPGRILFINQHAGFIGGLERYIHAVSSQLRAAGFKTAMLYVEKTKEADRFLAGFDEVFDIGQIGEMNAADYAHPTLHKISDPKILAAVLKKFSPAVVVHDHDYFCPKGFKYFPYKRKNCRRPYCRMFCGICASLVPPRHWKAAGVSTLLKKNFFESARLSKLIKTAPRFVVLSRFMKECLAANGIPESKIHILHPFISAMPAPVARAENKPPRIIFAGQQVMSKGLPLLLESFSKMKADATLTILGTGPRFDDFKNLSESMGFAGKVTFAGWVKNPEAHYATADFAVFPSLWQEPFGLVGIEAMSYGLPVAAFDVGGVSEWLRHNENGILVPERDTGAMAAALDTLATDAALRARLGENAKSFVSRQFTAQNFSEKFIKTV